MIVVAIVLAALIADFVGHELGPNTTQILIVVVPTFVGIQGFVDMLKYREQKRQGDKNDSGQTVA